MYDSYFTICDYEAEKKEEPTLEARPSTEPHCLKCGWGIEESKHYGRVWLFDARTDKLHVCRPNVSFKKTIEKDEQPKAQP